ncbi:MAG: hypothetical protein V1742_02680 [Pseudomonadota bacterium]
MHRKAEAKTVLRSVVPYPAVFVPNQYGGYDVYFPNFPISGLTGLNFNLALKAAQEELTQLLYADLKQGRLPPAPSSPDSLEADEELIPGTIAVMIEPDKDGLLRQLGMQKKRLRTSPTGVKYTP